MALFQNSVLNKYLRQQDIDVVAKAYKKFARYFHNSAIQQNIRERKEEQFQEGFLIELFVNVLDYTLAPNPGFNLTTELKNEKGAKKADGAILKDGNALGVIELKSTKTKDLEKVRQQAFDYKANQTGCVYVITSNFEKVRFYIKNAVEFEEFDLFTINRERFELLYLCLAKDNILSDIPLKIKEASLHEEEKITKKFYADYSLFKRELFRDLVKGNMKNEVFRTELNNEDTERANKNIKHYLFKESQKLIDRFLFIFFAEDRGLLPPNSTLKILENWDKLNELDAAVPLYDRYKLYFKFLGQGRAGTGKKAEIFAYNGGLFKPDTVLDSLLISDELLYKHTRDLSHYDFESQVDVNILGHIFENSLNEIESVNAEIEGTDFDKQKTKRKKDGVFYTPKYITKYIVDNTVGKLCDEKKAELKIVEEEYHPKRQKETKKKLLATLEAYREWLLQLTILDPACGSGAFLNQALDFLIKEHQYLDELQTRLLGGGFVFPNIENTVLENNIFGVDLNEESVEIAKLSLWLRTAQPRRKLNNLSSNIKCGNSLIDSKAVAGDKAFKWEEEFAHIFKEKDKKAFHITTATHDSRTSQRMIDYKVRQLRDNGTRPKAEGIWLEPEDEILITKTVARIVQEDNLNILAYNICGDHIHVLLVCEEEEVTKIAGKIKGKTSRVYNSNKGINPLVQKEKEKSVSLWTQKFGSKEIASEKQLWNTVEYIQNNRIKHELPPHSSDASSRGISPLVKTINEMCCTYDHAFRTEKKGGFDVVIGNPPYVRKQGLMEHYPEMCDFYEKTFISSTGNYDIYALFMEHSYSLINDTGIVSFILPHKFLISDFGVGIRKFFKENKAVENLIHFGSEIVFQEASTYTCIVDLTKKPKDVLRFNHLKPKDLFDNIKNSEIPYSKLSNDQWILTNNKISEVLGKINQQPLKLKDVFARFVQGIITGKDAVFCVKGELNGEFLNITDEKENKHKIETGILKPHLRGEDVNKFKSLGNNEWLIFPYVLIDGKAELISPSELESKYPNTLNYLRGYESILREREKGKFNNEYWYQYSRNQAISVLEQHKIITPEVCFGGSMTLDENNFYHNSKCHTLLLKENAGFTYKSVLPLINSSLFWFYLSNTGNVLRGGYIGVKRKVLEPFSIPNPESVEIDKLENYTDLMLEKKEQHQSVSNKFIKYLQSQFPIEKLPKKLQNWHELAFGDFIKELNKAIKNAGGQKLSKIQEMDWMEVFETKKAEAQTLKTEIDKTDAEIDNMVYQLYGLTDEEIAIVENS